MLERLKRFYQEHEPSCTVGFFVAGFIFDTMAVGRIDSLHNILHQASYLFLCAWFIGLEWREIHGDFSPPPRLKTAWRYHKGATHFMLGTLLNIYTLFYFKSASLGVSFMFLVIMAALLAVNELKPFENYGATLRMALFSLCLITYFGYLVPMLFGWIGLVPFIGSLAASALTVGLLFRPIQRHALLPFIGVAAALTVLYTAKITPPVPLSLSYIGIYHDVRREGPRFALTMTRPRWKFWQRGDQTFWARPGDKIHCFVSVFSPGRFRERLQLRWFFKDPAAGWRDYGVIPLEITGGRAEGFRSDTIKSHYKPGRWRVRVETSDGRELGRISLTVVNDDSDQSPRARTVWR